MLNRTPVSDRFLDVTTRLAIRRKESFSALVAKAESASFIGKSVSSGLYFGSILSLE